MRRVTFIGWVVDAVMIGGMIGFTAGTFIQEHKDLKACNEAVREAIRRGELRIGDLDSNAKGEPMAKVIITIEDIPEGKVKVVSDPSFEIMAKRTLSGHDLTAAHGYALRALNAITDAAKQQRIITKLPKLRRA